MKQRRTSPHRHPRRKRSSPQHQRHSVTISDNRSDRQKHRTQPPLPAETIPDHSLIRRPQIQPTPSRCHRTQQQLQNPPTCWRRWRQIGDQNQSTATPASVKVKQTKTLRPVAGSPPQAAARRTTHRMSRRVITRRPAANAGVAAPVQPGAPPLATKPTVREGAKRLSCPTRQAFSYNPLRRVEPRPPSRQLGRFAPSCKTSFH